MFYDRADIDLSRRSGAREIMDDGRLGLDDFQHCLRDLSRINRLSLGYRPTLTWLAECLRRHGHSRPISVLDVGFGYGDTLRRLRTWSQRRGIDLQLYGIDINPWATRTAQGQTPADWAIRYETADIFEHRTERTHDIIISALFAHHLPDDVLIRFVRWMQDHARLGWFINDLHRGRSAYYGAKILLPLIGCGHVVRHDGIVSVARARTTDEWQRILAQADVPPSAVEIQRYVPFRIGVGCVR